MGLGLDPATMGSLANTLTPAGILTAMDAERQRQAEELARRTADATTQANQAGQAYTSAASQPTPDLSPADTLLPTILSHLASTISGDKSYVDTTRSDLQRQRSDLLKARTDNLTALKATFDEKAKAAESAGDLQATQTARQKSEQLAKTLEVLLSQQNHDEAINLEKLKQTGASSLEAQKGRQSLAEIAARGAQDEKAAKAKAAADSAGYFDTLVTTTRAGNKFLDLTNVPTPKQKAQAMQYAKDNGVTALNKNDVAQLRTADEVNAGLDQVESMLGTVLPHQSGNSVKDFLTRQMRGAANAGQAIAQSNSTPAAFGSTMPLAIRSLQAVAAGPGSGFRLNQGEINMINRRWPKLNDNIETAQAKLQWERWFLRNKENSYFNHDWGVEDEPVVPGQAKTGLLERGAGTSGDPLGILGAR